jgi:hypothetical protein
LQNIVKLPYPLLIAFLVCLAPPAVFLAFAGGGEAARPTADYATVVFDEGADVAGLLSAHGVKNVVSARTARAFLNDFDGIKVVSAAEWEERVERFDPRNDGYAERVRSMFFTEGGKRRLFIPRGEFFLGAFRSSPDAKLIDALEGAGAQVRFQTEYRRGLQGWALNGAMFAAASFLLAFVARKVFVLSKDVFIFHYALGFIPSLAMLAGLGATGLALAAPALALFQTLKRPGLRCAARVRCEKNRRTGDLSFLSPARRMAGLFVLLCAELEAELPEIMVFVALYVGICAAGSVPLGLSFCFAAFFFLSFVFMLRVESRRGERTAHIPFVCVPIQGRRRAALPPLPVPFIAAAIVHMALSALLGGPDVAAASHPHDGWEAGALVSEEDYRNHVEFQRRFSFRNLNTEKAGDYLRYALGNDGLLSSSESVRAEAELAAPPWDLAGIAAFLGSDESEPKLYESAGKGGGWAIVLALCLYLPFVVQRRFLRRRNKLAFLICLSRGEDEAAA